MVAIDTNIIVRLLTNDDPVQVARARSLVSRETVWVGLAVLMECEWVLRSVYRLDRRVIHDSLQRFTNLAQVVIEAEPCLQRILNLYSEGLDFADAVHLVAARGHATAFASFDSSLAQRANAISVKPPVVAP